MHSSWNTFIQDFFQRAGSSRARLRESIVKATTAEEVVSALSAEAEAHAEDSPEMQMLRAQCSASIEIIHRLALADLQSVQQGQFERLLHWHIVSNLLPCRDIFPELHADFEMQLQRAACARWLLEDRHESQTIH